MATTLEVKTLRTCNKCGLEAWIEEDLEKFVKRKGCPHNVKPLCKKCHNEHIRSKYIPVSKPDYLRKCRVCGLEANNTTDLVLFRKCKKSKYGRQNQCSKCFNQTFLNKRKLDLVYRVGTNGVPIETRHKIISRAKGLCESKAKTPCSGSLLIHHIDENIENNELSNLVLLCRRHHIIEAHKILEKSVLPLRGKDHWNWQENPTPSALYQRKRRAKRRAQAKIEGWLEEIR